MVERVPAKVAAKAAAKRKQPDEATASGSMPILPPSKSANLELAATVAAGGDGLVVVSEKKTKEAKGGSKYKGVYADKAVASKREILHPHQPSRGAPGLLRFRARGCPRVRQG